jgi:hypothetical protein
VQSFIPQMVYMLGLSFVYQDIRVRCQHLPVGRHGVSSWGSTRPGQVERCCWSPVLLSADQRQLCF